MHFFDVSRRFYGGYAIVGGGLPVAAGIALAQKMRSEPNITACFFGDGAVAEGEFHETLNLAALWQLPVLFLCENNLYAMGTALKVTLSETDIARKAQGYRVPSVAVDGMDVLAVEDAARQAAADVRNGQGPRLLELRTYRFRGHSMADPELYREKAEVEEWKKRDPIPAFQDYLLDRELLSAQGLQEIEAGIAAEIDDAVDYAEQSPWEPLEDVAKDVSTE
jgi:TPP-dependent pyruvate/acetoin dehydrogenase alpha subunit